MNPTSRAILESVVSTDASLSAPERGVIERLLRGLLEVPSPPRSADEPLLVTQKVAAQLLSVSRVTVWRLAKDGVLHPVEIFPGTWRYAYAEIMKLARAGSTATAERLEPAA